jgi:RNA polymerase I-specific transcription initiation factor RRN7
VDVYAAAQRLAKILKLDLSWPNNRVRHRIESYPETQVISLIVIATKLAHPFDDIIRVPDSMKDSSALRVDWDAWQQNMREEAPRTFRKGEEVKVTETDALTMNGEKLDDYLDWYQRTWIDDKDPKSECALPWSCQYHMVQLH